MRMFPLVLAAAGILGIALTMSPARADWDDEDQWEQHEAAENAWRAHRLEERREQLWRAHEWREQHEYRGPATTFVYGAPGPVYYARPQPHYYVPQTYYAPTPQYYAPPPPPVYAAPGVSIGFGFAFR